MVEILGGNGLYTAFEELNIHAECTYQGSDPYYYEVWRLSKHDLKRLEEEPVWDDSWGWYVYAWGSRMGSACEVLDIKGQTIIGWETLDQQTQYNSLIEYFIYGFQISNHEAICALSVDLARANGMSLGKLFTLCEG